MTHSDKFLWDNIVLALVYPSLNKCTNTFCALVACVAGGLDLGVAPRANLYLVKQEGFIINANTGETDSGYVTYSGLVEVANKILDVLDTEQVPEGRAVLTLSAGL